jgi:V/A-type H+-transporting ATPase subunit K
MQYFLGLTGYHWALLGAAVASIGGGAGSAAGITYIAHVAGGIITEDPDKFGPMLPLIAISGTQGIYGFITGILVAIFFGLLGGAGPKIQPLIGFEIFCACLPVAFTCCISAIYQGLTSVGAAPMVAKRTEEAGKALILPALVETYAVLSLILSIILMLTIKASM